MYHVATSHVDDWIPQYIKDAEGKDTAAYEWVRTGEVIKVTEVSDAVIKDADRCQTARPIYLYSTADGPMLAIALKNTAESIELLDPCIVAFDGKAHIKLVPIFGVARVLTIARTSVRTWQPPMEMLLAIYPGFLVQNRSYKYQLRPNVPFVTTPELTNDGT